MAPPSPPAVELFYDGIWNDITPKVYRRDGIDITRGTPGETATADPSSCTFTLNNRDGRFTPRNSVGPLYGKIGRNTPVRVRKPLANNALVLKGTTTSYASTPDNAALDLTNFVDIAVEFTLDKLGSTIGLLSKGLFGSTLSYGFLIGFTNGVPHLTYRWSTNGTTVQFFDHDMPELQPGQRTAVRVAAAHNGGFVTFYTGPSIAGPWTQHGAASGPISAVAPFNSTDPLLIGQSGSGLDPFLGAIRAAQVRSVIGGTIVANPDFTAQTAGTTSFTDSAGRTWTVQAGASIGIEYTTRFSGEMASWPQSWDQSGTDVYTQVQAAGVLRRLGQGQAPKQTGLNAFVTNKHFDQCWPGDTPGSLSALHTRLVLDHCAANVHYGQGDFGDGFPAGMLIDTTNLVTGNVYPARGFIGGYIGAAPGGTFEAAGFVFQASGLGSMAFYLTAYGNLFPGGYVVLFDAVAQTVTIYRINYDPDGVVGYNVTLIDASPGGLPFFTDGSLHSFLWTIQDTGANLTHTVYIDGANVATGLEGAYSSLQGMSGFKFTYDPTTVDSGSALALSYVTMWSDQFGDQTLPDPTDWAQAADGYVGETAGRRIQRLCQENAIPFVGIGDLDNTIPMGPQGNGDLLSTLAEAADADLGVLFEPRAVLGLTYRTRASRYNRMPDATFNYAANVLGTPPDVTDDDFNVRNDVTAARTAGGASARDTLTSGALSVQAPPNGIGQYATSVSVNVVSDALLPDQASWRLALSTIDESRLPVLGLNLRTGAVANNAALLAAIIALDVTSQIALTNPPAWLAPGQIDQLIQGYTETFDGFVWTITFNTLPASVYTVATYATSPSVGDSHYDAEFSLVHTAFNTTATALSIESSGGTQPWTTDPAAIPFDINIGGERMTVTLVTGASSPQTLTVVRSVNGVVKAHALAEPVRLWNTPRYAL